MTTKPNPGSDEAIAAGCSCPVLDNAHGKGCGYLNADCAPMFWINADCPMHGSPQARNAVDTMRALRKAVGAE